MMVQTIKNKNALIRERRTIGIMIQMYCSNFHDTKNDLCVDCCKLFKYANSQLDYCT